MKFKNQEVCQNCGHKKNRHFSKGKNGHCKKTYGYLSKEVCQCKNFVVENEK